MGIHPHTLKDILEPLISQPACFWTAGEVCTGRTEPGWKGIWVAQVFGLYFLRDLLAKAEILTKQTHENDLA